MINSAPIKIAFFTGSFQFGGTERYLLNLLENIDRQLFHPTIMCFDKSGGFYSEFQKLNIDIEDFPIKNSFLNTTGIRSLMKALAFLKKNDIQIIHTLADSGNYFGAFAGKLAGIKTIIVSQRNMGHLMKKKRYAFITKVLYKYLSNGIIVNAGSIKNHLIKEFRITPDKIEVIHNGIAFNRTSVEKKKSKEAGDSITAGFIGRFHPIKGFSILIDAAKNVIKEYPDIVFLVIGDGRESNDLKSKINNFGIMKNFQFVGNQKDVQSYISKMDFVILPSKSEGLPNIVLEAMVCKKPVVATCVGGVPEVVIDGETGIIIEPGDVNALSDSIKKLIDNEDIRKKMGFAAFKRVKEHFSIDKMMEQHSKYYLGKSTWRIND